MGELRELPLIVILAIWIVVAATAIGAFLLLTPNSVPHRTHQTSPHP